LRNILDGLGSLNFFFLDIEEFIEYFGVGFILFFHRGDLLDNVHCGKKNFYLVKIIVIAI